MFDLGKLHWHVLYYIKGEVHGTPQQLADSLALQTSVMNIVHDEEHGETFITSTMYYKMIHCETKLGNTPHYNA